MLFPLAQNHWTHRLQAPLTYLQCPHAARTWYACESQKPRSITLQRGRAGRFVRYWASGGSKFTKMGDSLPWTPMNRRAKFDAASFILGGELRNCTNKQTHKQ